MSRHLFWGPSLGATSLKAIPLGPRGSFVGLGGPFMSQAPSGLESLTITAIQNRILATPPLERLGAHLASGSGNRSIDPLNGLVRSPQEPLGGIPHPPSLSDAEISVIQSIAASPSSDDLDAIALITTFFAGRPGWGPDQQNKPWQTSLTQELCDLMNGRQSSFGRGQPTTAQQVYTWLTASTPGRGLSPGTPSNSSDAELEAIRSNPFFCGRPASLPDSLLALSSYADFFGIDGSGTWGSVKLQVENAVVVLNAVAAYPFPPPIDEYVIAFWAEMGGDIREIVSTPYPVDPEAVRIWITLSVLANYTDMTNKIEAELKRKAKKSKRKALMTTIGLVLASIVAAFLLPVVVGAIAAAIKTAVTTYIDAQKRRKAAQDMANASKMFADDAPAFSKEVDHAAQVMDQQAAEQEAAATPPPDVQAAIQEVKADTGPAWGTILPVGGGIAAAGLAVFAIFK
jgi:hypothetical protein